MARIPNKELAIFFIVTVAIFCSLSPSFRTGENFENILVGFSHMGVLAVGQAFPILLGGIDLSVGSIVALAGMVGFDGFLIFGLPGAIVIPVMLATSVVAGIFNGVLITGARLQPFVATLATMAVYRGVTYAISGRQLFPELATRSIDDDLLLGLDNYVGHFPYAFFLLLIVAGLSQLLLAATRFGRDVYAVGGNREAARLAGIPIGRTTAICYAISGFCAGLAALILVSRMTTSQENLGIGIELSAIAAAIVGGASLQGGTGNAIGPVIGAFLLGVILIGLNLVGITTYAQPVLTGLILLGAVYYDRVLLGRRRLRLGKSQ
ncbi:MAG: ABC transporter permease [Methylobacteriaceae bacterium]|nr:ABC transporter permease [Methylobacteriaceae bacterium]